MKMHVKFENIESLSQLSKEKFHIDIVSEVSGLVQVYSIERYSLVRTVDVFNTHHHIQKEITKSNAIEGYELLLDSLKKEAQSGDFEIYQINIVTENSGYIFFTDLNFTDLLGILKMNKQRVVKNVELNEKNELRGTWGNRKFYLNGIPLN